MFENSSVHNGVALETQLHLGDYRLHKEQQKGAEKEPRSKGESGKVLAGDRAMSARVPASGVRAAPWDLIRTQQPRSEQSGGPTIG